MYIKMILLLLMIADSIWGAQILGVLHVPMHSHHKLMNTIFQELAVRGHQVTAISPFKVNSTKNFKSIELTGSIEKFSDLQKLIVSKGHENPFAKYKIYEMAGLNITEELFAHKNVQNLLNSDEVFDLVIMEQSFNEGIKIFCHHYNAPCVSVTTFSASRYSNVQMGNPGPPSVIPDVLSGFSGTMSFLERLYNLYLYVMGEIYLQFYVLPKHDSLLQKYFLHAPPMYDITYNMSLLLVNTHVSLNYAVAYVPNMIEIGGFHIGTPKKLPKEMQQFLDNAKHGVIYFSLGSTFKTTSLSLETLKGILKIFSKVKENILWKWDQDSFEGKPENVMLQKWLPQNDILAHPNIKLFITQGGQLSISETVYYGVPILGIPVFGDQIINVANAVRNGFAVALPYKELSLKKFENALNEVLNNSSYSKNAKKVSKIFHDRPMKPLDTAMYWIEYILRHGGAPHLRTAALNLTWYQYLSLDVVAVFLVALITIVGLIWTIVKYFYAKETKNNGKKEN